MGALWLGRRSEGGPCGVGLGLGVWAEREERKGVYD
jgi:hypothetical protein